uniref:Cell cycle link protein n=1 Tax=Cardamom bushy dwarf virus TaxID=262588 RepID=W0G077_9VIRU|nr:cell cycle link protein [Cardamom bushy dwarf virus]
MDRWEEDVYPVDVKRVIKEYYWRSRLNLLFCEKVKRQVRRILGFGDFDDAMLAVKEMKTSIVALAAKMKKDSVVICEVTNKSVANRLNTMSFFYHEYVEDQGDTYSVDVVLFCDEELPSSSENDEENVIYRNVIMASKDEKISYESCIWIVIGDDGVTVL